MDRSHTALPHNYDVSLKKNTIQGCKYRRCSCTSRCSKTINGQVQEVTRTVSEMLGNDRTQGVQGFVGEAFGVWEVTKRQMSWDENGLGIFVELFYFRDNICNI